MVARFKLHLPEQLVCELSMLIVSLCQCLLHLVVILGSGLDFLKDATEDLEHIGHVLPDFALMLLENLDVDLGFDLVEDYVKKLLLQFLFQKESLDHSSKLLHALRLLHLAVKHLDYLRELVIFLLEFKVQGLSLKLLTL